MKAEINFLALGEAYGNYCDYKCAFSQIHKIEREDWIPNFSPKKRDIYERYCEAEKVLTSIMWLLNIDDTKMMPIFASIKRRQNKSCKVIHWENYVIDHIISRADEA